MCVCVQEYLRILRWNDSNYWAIRQTTIRSHRSLVKYMNKYKVYNDTCYEVLVVPFTNKAIILPFNHWLHFTLCQDVLGQPVRPVLTTTAMGEREEEEEEEGGKIRVEDGESRLHRLIRTLSAAEWVSQTRVMVRMGREREREGYHAYIHLLSHQVVDDTDLLTVPIDGGDTLTVTECHTRMQQLVCSYSTHRLPPSWCSRVDDLTEHIAAVYQDLQTTPTSDPPTKGSQSEVSYQHSLNSDSA